MEDRDLDPAAVKALLDSHQAVLIDVREHAEFAAERIEGARLFPLSAFDPATLPPGRLIFQCGIGKRSLAALQRYESAGFSNAQHMQGGLAAWKQAGLPTTRG